MSGYGDYRVIVYDRRGFPLEELDVSFHCIWSMNEQGTAALALSMRTDPKCRESLLRFGNLVEFQHARLGGWAGPIVPSDGMDWNGTGEMLVRMRSGEYQFARRRAPFINWEDRTMGLSGRVGDVVEKLIAWGNWAQDTRLRPNNLHSSKKIMAVPLFDAMINTLIDKLTERRKMYLWAEPARDENNLLIMNVNMVELTDEPPVYVLQEDINLETPSGMVYRRDGELINDVMVRNDPEVDGGLIRRQAQDFVSQDEYGLWQGESSLSTDEEFLVQWMADSIVEAQSEPLKKLTLIAIETPESPDTFAHIRVGKTVRVIMHSVGFWHGTTGLDEEAQIVSMEYDTDENKVMVVVEVKP
jgi:hypothetical protein